MHLRVKKLDLHIFDHTSLVFMIIPLPPHAEGNYSSTRQHFISPAAERTGGETMIQPIEMTIFQSNTFQTD